MSSPITIENTITIANGLVHSEKAAIAVIGWEKVVKLLDVPQSAQALLHIFFRRVALLGRHDFLDFLFEHVDHKLVYRLVPGNVGALLYLLEKLALDLDLMGTEHLILRCFVPVLCKSKYFASSIGF